MNLFDQRTQLAESFTRIRAGFLKHKKADATRAALYGRFSPSDPTKLMIFDDTQNCTPAGESFGELLAIDDTEEAKTMNMCLVRSVIDLGLKPAREAKLFQDIIMVLEKSRAAHHPAVVSAVHKMQPFTKVALPKTSKRRDKMAKAA